MINHNSIVCKLLSILYGIGLRIWYLSVKMSKKKRLGSRVISIGNIEMGGTGKTPLVMEIANRLHRAGKTAVVLTRGYKRKSRQCTFVDTEHNVELFGEEPFLIKKYGGVPVFVCAKRERVSEYLKDMPDFFIMDDGFQYLKLHRDVDIVIISKALATNGDKLFPSGYLREPVSAAERAQIIVVNWRFDRSGKLNEYWKNLGKPLFNMHYKVSGIFDARDKPVHIKQGSSVALISAIAKNNEFRDAVEGMLNLRVSSHLSARDHHYFNHLKVLDFIRSVKAKGVKYIITTDKDFEKLRLNNVLRMRLGVEIDDTFFSFIHFEEHKYPRD